MAHIKGTVAYPTYTWQISVHQHRTSLERGHYNTFTDGMPKQALLSKELNKDELPWIPDLNYDFSCYLFFFFFFAVSVF